MTPMKRKMTILSSAAVLLLVAWFFLLLFPLQTSLRTKLVALDQERIQFEIAKLEEKNIQTTANDLERLRSTTDVHRGYFVTENSILDFISSLERVAQENNVTQEIVNLETPENGKTSTNFRLRIQGSFNDCMRYMGALQRVETYVNIQQLSFSRLSDDTNKVSVDIQSLLAWL